MKTVLRIPLIFALVGAALAASAQNLVLDPGFESAPNGGYFAQGTTIDGGSWFTAAPPTGTYANVYVDKNPNRVISGTTDAILLSSSLQQTLVTVPGLSYSIRLDAYGLTGTVPFSVTFGDTTMSFTAIQSAYGSSGVANVGHFSFIGNASSASTLLSIGTSAQDYLAIDNVSVSPASSVPGPLAALPFALMAVRRRRRKA